MLGRLWCPRPPFLGLCTSAVSRHPCLQPHPHALTPPPAGMLSVWHLPAAGSTEADTCTNPPGFVAPETRLPGGMAGVLQRLTQVAS